MQLRSKRSSRSKRILLLVFSMRLKINACFCIYFIVMRAIGRGTSTRFPPFTLPRLSSPPECVPLKRRWEYVRARSTQISVAVICQAVPAQDKSLPLLIIHGHTGTAKITAKYSTQNFGFVFLFFFFFSFKQENNKKNSMNCRTNLVINASDTGCFL